MKFPRFSAYCPLAAALVWATCLGWVVQGQELVHAATVVSPDALPYAAPATTATAATAAPLAAPPSSIVLPPAIEAALARAQYPRNALSVLVLDAEGHAPARLSYRADVPVNPASVMKLVTTYAALDMLGADYTWKTPVYFDGPVQGGVLRGNLIIQGQGDPKLVIENIAALLKRVQSLGVTTVEGDIVLDRSAFNVPEPDPASFDGEPLRPYNAAPDALLLNFKSVMLTLTPDRAAGVARIRYEPPLANFEVPASVPLQRGECGDFRAELHADFSDPNRVLLAGAFPTRCGEKVWPVLYADAKSYATRMVEGLWVQTGGKLTGKLRYGTAPVGLRPAFEYSSPPLQEIVQDINKFSNNVMAQQVFLRLGVEAESARHRALASPTIGPFPGPSDGPVSASKVALPVATFSAAREAVHTWWVSHWPGVAAPSLENGSGLSRTERITAVALGQLLQTAYASPVAAALQASLPIAGVDGTLRKAKVQSGFGMAQMKTGSLRDVAAVAGYVRGTSGKRYVLIAIANHPTLANAARPVFDALMDWTAQDQ